MTTTLILAACALACPLTMVAMILFMRGNHGKGERRAKESERR
jgi:hypothetical protein